MTHRLAALAISAACAFVALPRAQHHDLGSVRFPTSCRPAVQAEFERGVAMLHSYWFSYAAKTFRGVLEQDPGCAMAYWGIAMDMLGNTLAAPPSPKVAREAWETLEKARTVKTATERERDWIEALRAYFRDHESKPVDVRLLAYTEALTRLARKYPDDFEAQVYYALALQASAPKTDLTYRNQAQSADLLEKLYAQNPQHPGITHYLIHAYDFAPFADKGIAAARRYAAIAPAVPHARHMPAHIYSMVGLWEDSVSSNRSALEIQPDYYHASDFIVYAQLQLAQDAAAAETTKKALDTPERGDRPPTVANYTAKAAMPARLALERGDWAAAAALPITTSDYPHADALTRFARALGMARSGRLADARQEIAALERLRTALEKAHEPYWAARTGEQIQAASAWVAFGDGARDSALALMRKAADGENGSIKHVAMENRLYPMRELLGELLLEANQAEAALVEFRKALEATPNRFRGISGAARAAQAAGDRQAATEYYTTLMRLAHKADGLRPEVQQAKTFLAGEGQSTSAKPNFSGEWKLDLAQSSFGPLPPPTSVTRSIKHTEPALDIVENQQSDLGDQTVSRSYRTDGTETMFTAQGAEVKGSAKWSDNMLVVVSTVDVAGLSFNDAMTLSADGKTLTSVVKMTTAQGDLDMKLVFVKQ